MNDIRFIQQRPDGSLDVALGSDSVVAARLSDSLAVVHRKALEQARRLRAVQPGYLGYSIKGLAPRLFTKTELALIQERSPA